MNMVARVGVSLAGQMSCQPMLMRLQGYSKHAEQVPGEHVIVPDNLPRCPIRKLNQTEGFAEKFECHVNLLENSRQLNDKLLGQIQGVTEGDSFLQY